MVSNAAAIVVDTKKVQKDTSKEVDDLHVKLSDGQVIAKTKWVFKTRQAETTDGRKVELTLDGVVYERVGGALIRRTGKVKLSKAAKKAVKREKVAQRRAEV